MQGMEPPHEVLFAVHTAPALELNNSKKKQVKGSLNFFLSKDHKMNRTPQGERLSQRGSRSHKALEHIGSMPRQGPRLTEKKSASGLGNLTYRCPTARTAVPGEFRTAELSMIPLVVLGNPDYLVFWEQS